MVFVQFLKVKCLTKKLTLYFIPEIIPMVLLILFYLVDNDNVPNILF